MSRRRFASAFAVILFAAAVQAQTPLTAAITYQGRLESAGSPANGAYDFIFRLFDAAQNGNQVGSNITVNDLTVTDGLFTAQLNFGQSAYNGDARWLDVQVRVGTSTGIYTPLSPRQPMTAAPFALYAASAAGPWTVSGNNVYTTATGNVGIGSSNPLAKLSVFGAVENTSLANGALFLQSAGGPFGQIMTMDGDEINGWSHLHLNPDATTNIYMVEGGGDVGIGTNSPGQKLDVNGRIHVRQGGTASAGIYFYQDAPAADRGFIGMRNDTQIGLYGTQGAGWGMIMDVATGNIGVNTTAPAVQFHVNGTARVNVLEIAGADVAEKFPVTRPDELKPGMVVMIDAENPGKLCLARGAYNKKVAGIISGANGLPAGTVLGHLPGSEDAPPVALTGRVWVWCDASSQPIEPGDLLTTADAPGFAMVASDVARSHGTVIGKAMTALARGERGLVLVLVNLQ